jgi:D-amino-acid oxidase
MHVLVLGCGVSGLTTGISLLEAGHTVTIWTKDLPQQTTSSVAAAVWYPYKAYPEDRVTAWGATAYRTFADLADVPGSGVLLATLIDLKPSPSPDPWWVSAVSGFRRATSDELPAGYVDGYVFTAPVMEMPLYLDYLLRRFHEASGVVEQRAVERLDDAFAAASIVINCVGLGACTLVGDTDLHPSRGQVVRVRHNGFRRVVLDDDGPNRVAYIVPRLNDIVLGGVDDEYNESVAIDPALTPDILARCANLAPAFAQLRSDDILSVACGLRPVRSTVRVELERLPLERILIHNYGHGGAGVTLSWGCAAEVSTLVAQALQ